MYWSQTESSKWSLDSLSFHPRRPFRRPFCRHRYPHMGRQCYRSPPGTISGAKIPDKDEITLKSGRTVQGRRARSTLQSGGGVAEGSRLEQDSTRG
eukprot:scaffold6169_cov34-Phaeocystis_antarctica.AAC.2